MTERDAAARFPDAPGRHGRLWNANIHYDARLAACVPAAAEAVLDVGCGDGFLAARLAPRVPHVVAIDIDAAVLGRARARFPDAPVTWCHGDILTHPLEAESFDAVLSNATLHHLPDTRAALRRLSRLVRPGGTLGIAPVEEVTRMDTAPASAREALDMVRAGLGYLAADAAQLPATIQAECLRELEQAD